MVCFEIIEAILAQFFAIEKDNFCVYHNHVSKIIIQLHGATKLAFTYCFHLRIPDWQEEIIEQGRDEEAKKKKQGKEQFKYEFLNPNDTARQNFAAPARQLIQR